MDNDLFVAELKYQTSLAIAKQLLEVEILRKDEFVALKTLLLKKYQPPISSLHHTSVDYRENIGN